MAQRLTPEMSPWNRHALTIPPNTWRAWMRLAIWEGWMGMVVFGALGSGVYLIATAPDRFITVLDFTNCYAAPPVIQPCERVAYQTGALNMAFMFLFGLLLLGVAAWFLWELWSAVAPKPIADDFLKLLDYSFGRDWRKPRTWPWARIGWAYGFTLLGATSAACLALALWTIVSSSERAKAPSAHVDTSQRFRLGQ